MTVFRLSAATAALLAAVPASAQILPPDEGERYLRTTAVRDRQVPGYDAPGLPVGVFTLSPSLMVDANYTDNLFATEDDTTDDAFLRVAPSLRLQTDGRTRSLNVSADASFDRHLRRSSENVDAVSLSAYGTQELPGDLRLRGIARFRVDRESRESQNAFAFTRRPVNYRAGGGGVGVSKRVNKWMLAVEGGLERVDFDDAQFTGGGVLDQDYRDGSVRQVLGRIDFLLSPAVAQFVRVTHNSSVYAQRSPLGIRRGAETTEALAGARFELPVLARGEIGIGYIQSSFRDGRERHFSGLAVNTHVTFFPTQLTNVTVSAVRSVNDAGTPESSTYVATVGGIQVDHELYRSLILGAGAQYERDRFNGADRSDRRIAVNATADYRLNPWLSLRLSYDRLDLSSHGTERYKSFTRNRGMIGLGVRI